MEKIELPSQHKCAVCGESVVNERFEIVTRNGANGRLGGSHPFWVSAKSDGFVCSNPTCRLVYDFARTMDQSKLEAITFQALALEKKYQVKEKFEGLEVGQVVYLVPELSGSSSSMIRRTDSDDDFTSVCNKPDIKADRIRVPSKILERV